MTDIMEAHCAYKTLCVETMLQKQFFACELLAFMREPKKFTHSIAMLKSVSSGWPQFVQAACSHTCSCETMSKSLESALKNCYLQEKAIFDLWRSGTGKAVNSSCESLDVNGLETNEVKSKVLEWLESKQLGSVQVNYKLRDWLFARQRYWGEPFPLSYAEGSDVSILLYNATLTCQIARVSKIHAIFSALALQWPGTSTFVLHYNVSCLDMNPNVHTFIKHVFLEIECLVALEMEPCHHQKQHILLCFYLWLGHWLQDAVPISDAELPLTLPETDDFKPSGEAESPLAKIKDWITYQDPSTGKQISSSIFMS